MRVQLTSTAPANSAREAGLAYPKRAGGRPRPRLSCWWRRGGRALGGRTPLSFCYSDNEDGRGYTGPIVPYHAQKATEHWLKHLENSLYLTFLAKNETDFANRARAMKELEIADRKMSHWRRHPNWDAKEADRLGRVLKARWDAPRGTNV